MISCTREELETARERVPPGASIWRVLIFGDALRYIYSGGDTPMRTLEFERVVVPGEGTRLLLATRIRLILSEEEKLQVRRRNADAKAGFSGRIWPALWPTVDDRGHYVEYCELPVTRTGTPNPTPP